MILWRGGESEETSSKQGTEQKTEEEKEQEKGKDNETGVVIGEARRTEINTIQNPHG